MGDRLDRVRRLVAQQTSDPEGRSGTADRLHRLCGAVVDGLPASAAGVSVMTDAGVRGVAAASDETCVAVEELQFTLGEGPCIDAYAHRRPVLEPDLGTGLRWPGYTRAAHDKGVRAVFAFPLQIGAARLGVLDVYRQRPGSLSDDALADALTFADVATVALLDGQRDTPDGDAADRIDEVLENRFELYQAQGMVAVQLDTGMAEAMLRLRAYAFAHDRPLAEVARAVLDRRLVLGRDS